MRLPDITGIVPTRRMSVARGKLVGFTAVSEEVLATARVAALLAVKDAARTVPTLPPFHVTDAFCDFAAEVGGLHCTVTVQGFARAPLASAALAGAAAALVSVLESSGHPEGALVRDLQVIQNVEN